MKSLLTKAFLVAESEKGQVKRCFKCCQEKPIDEFYRHSRMGDGHLGKCKECTKRDVAANYQARFLQYQEYERKRYQEPKRHACVVANGVKHCIRHPDRYKARQLAGNAVRDGRLIPQPCEICGKKAERHHPDYSKPLDVRWLCKEHHRGHKF